MRHDNFMPLALVALPNDKIGSTYRDGEPGFPSRMGFLHPRAAGALRCALRELGQALVLSDAWRAAGASLARRYPDGGGVRRGVKPPGFSAHNYGLAIDVDIRRTLQRTGLNKRQLDEKLAEHGWYCHRKDHRITSEAWHYNALVTGRGAEYLQETQGKRSTAAAVEAAILDLYGYAWAPSKLQLQRYLAFLALYTGAIDGLLGRKTREAVEAFQRAWKLKVDGVAGPATCRVLALRCAELRHPLTRGLWTVRL